MKYHWLILLPLAACSSLNNADSYLSGHLPVIGERCEHWQCFTAGGREQSEANKQARLAHEAELKANPPPPVTPPTANAHPINSAAP